MEFKFSEENLEKIKQEFKKYPVKKPAVMKLFMSSVHLKKQILM